MIERDVLCTFHFQSCLKYLTVLFCRLFEITQVSWTLPSKGAELSTNRHLVVSWTHWQGMAAAVCG